MAIRSSTVRTLPLLAALLLVVTIPATGASSRLTNFSGVDVTFQVESAIGAVPGHWSLTKQGFRNEYLPDSGFGKGIFSVPLDAPVAIAFDLDASNCVPCTRMKQRQHQLPNDSRHHNAYECRPGIDQRWAFFLASDESVRAGIDPGWVQSDKQAPRFPVSGPAKELLHFHEWITTKEILPGKRLACGAWFEGAYPPKKAYNEVRGDTTDVADYTIHDRAIYLIGAGNQPEYLYRSGEIAEAWKSTFELAFLPSGYSELEKVRFSYVYSVRGGFWLRVDFSRDFEGAGAEVGMLLLEFRNGKYELLAGASEIRMY